MISTPTHTIESRGTFVTRSDFYAIDIASTTTVVIDLTGQEIDAFLKLFASDGTLIGFDDDGGDGLNSRLTVTLDAGTYTIGASTIRSLGAYELLVTESTTAGGTTGGGTAEVISIVPGQTVTGVLSSGGVDFYTLTVTTNATLITDLTSDDFDTFLDLFDTGNPDEAGPTNLLAFNDDHGLGLNSQISLNLTAGTYLIGVSAFSGSGVYTLQVTEAIPTVVNPISLGVTVTGSLSASGAVDHYVFTLDQSTTVSIDLTSENFGRG